MSYTTIPSQSPIGSGKEAGQYRWLMAALAIWVFIGVLSLLSYVFVAGRMSNETSARGQFHFTALAGCGVRRHRHEDPELKIEESKTHRLPRDLSSDLCGRRLLARDFELVNPLSAVFGDIDIVLGIHTDAVSLVELTREAPGAAKARQDLARWAVDDFNLRVVLIDQENELLIGVV